MPGVGNPTRPTKGMLVTAIDLFAGAGGFTLGATMAGARVLWAANHWDAAVKVHATNHPEALHLCQDLHQANWDTVPRHDLLLASPACQGHSRARGTDQPRHDAARSTAWAVVSCAEFHRPSAFVVENVPEFAQWELYPPWLDAMRRLGYAISAQIHDAADHGVPQNRRRLFVVGVRGKRPLFVRLPRREHVPAETILVPSTNWSTVAGHCAKTVARVERGREQHGDRFLMAYYGNEKGGRSLSRPIGTITTKDRYALIDGDRMRMLAVDEYRAAMGFPASYTLPTNSTLAKHMLGNAVVPRVAADIIGFLREAA